MNNNYPFAFGVPLTGGCPTHYDVHTTRTLSAMKGQYADQAAYAALLAQGDVIVYEVYEIKRPEGVGELLHGISIVHPGRVGDEYFMTKGHFHAELATAEVYYCLRGSGRLVLETPEGDWSVQELRPGGVVYVPPRWAHRSVNTGDGDLALLYVCPAHAGHDYGTIERQGFRKLIVERDGRPSVVDNPRFRAGSPES